MFYYKSPRNKDCNGVAIEFTLAYLECFLIIFARIRMKYSVKIKHYMQMSATNLHFE